MRYSVGHSSKIWSLWRELNAGDNLVACLWCHGDIRLQSNKYDKVTITALGTGGVPPTEYPDEADAVLLDAMTPDAQIGDM